MENVESTETGDAARGDPDRIAAHVDTLHAYVRLRLGRALRAREGSIDIAQSVVREALEHADQFHGTDEGLRAWLMKRAENKIRDRARFWKRDRRDVAREAAHDVDVDRGAAEACRTLLTPSRIVSAREDIARLEAAFAELSEDHRRVILLARVAGLSHAEVARTMDKTELATRALLSRAMAKLAILLERD
ncbi:MAG: sigma-70 family RNA polymerase sigma factor [Planctomycetes bacterium]|nr:sigma-70 family RNA polymerase sigma factor [Planctomycetota bacterium]